MAGRNCLSCAPHWHACVLVSRLTWLPFFRFVFSFYGYFPAGFSFFFILGQLSVAFVKEFLLLLGSSCIYFSQCWLLSLVTSIYYDVFSDCDSCWFWKKITLWESWSKAARILSNFKIFEHCDAWIYFYHSKYM